jgi:hypothetical protein
MKPFCILAISFTALFANSNLADAGLVNLGTYGTSFAQNGPWDGFTNGSTITIDGVEFTVDNILPDGVVNEISSGNGGLGVNASGSADNPSQFDQNESFTFALNDDVFLFGMDFGGLGSGEQFQISSASLGTFTFDNNGASDIFSNTDSLGATFSDIVIGAGEEITFTFSSTGNAYIEGFQFSTVPEPTSIVMFGIACVGGLGFRRRRT